MFYNMDTRMKTKTRIEPKPQKTAAVPTAAVKGPKP
jgi:hypothetical protein